VEPEVMAVARQWLSKHIMAMNKYVTTEELSDMAFSMLSMTYQVNNM
jgi:hypothetical protein